MKITLLEHFTAYNNLAHNKHAVIVIADETVSAVKTYRIRSLSHTGFREISTLRNSAFIISTSI